MDDVDAVTIVMEQEMELRIAAARRPVVEVSEAPDGECWNGCGDLQLAGGHYCSAECAADHHQRKQSRKRQGA